MASRESFTSGADVDWQADLTDALLKDSVRFGKDEFKREGGLWAPYEIVLDDPCPSELTVLCVNALVARLADLAEVKGAKHVVAMPGMSEAVIDGTQEVFGNLGLNQRFIRYRSDRQAGRRGVPRMSWDHYDRGDPVVVVAACVDGPRAKSALLQRLAKENLKVEGFATLIDTGEFPHEARKADIPHVLGMIGALPLVCLLDRARQQGTIDDAMYELCTAWPRQA